MENPDDDKIAHLQLESVNSECEQDIMYNNFDDNEDPSNTNEVSEVKEESEMFQLPQILPTTAGWSSSDVATVQIKEELPCHLNNLGNCMSPTNFGEGTSHTNAVEQVKNEPEMFQLSQIISPATGWSCSGITANQVKEEKPSHLNTLVNCHGEDMSHPNAIAQVKEEPQMFLLPEITLPASDLGGRGVVTNQVKEEVPIHLNGLGNHIFPSTHGEVTDGLARVKVENSSHLNGTDGLARVKVENCSHLNGTENHIFPSNGIVDDKKEIDDLPEYNVLIIGHSYIQSLQRILPQIVYIEELGNVKFFFITRPGATVDSFSREASELEHQIKKETYSLILLWIGSNDLHQLKNLSVVADFFKKYATLYEWLQAVTEPTPIACAQIEPRFTEEYGCQENHYELYSLLADKFNMLLRRRRLADRIFINHSAGFLKNAALYERDGISLNKNGLNKLSERLKQFLLTALKSQQNL